MRKEVVFSELDKAFYKEGAICDVLMCDKWCSIPYRSTQYSGNMLVSFADSHPVDITFSPGLSGWYKVYVGLPIYKPEGLDNCVQIKLSSDPSFFELFTLKEPAWDEHCVEESLWRCVDMSGEDITLTRGFMGERCHTIISWFRFVPMSQEEVESYKREAGAKENKRLYFADDMHWHLFYDALEGEDDFKSILMPLADGDFEYASIENTNVYDGRCPCDDDKFAFIRSGDRRIHTRNRYLYNEQNITKVVKMGHEMGLKMVSAIRLDRWNFPFPYIQYYFDNRFGKEHPEYRMVDRDGKPMRSLSYAYPEVRRYIINHIIDMARLGFDAVALLFSRRVPLLHFEEPVAKRFYEKYGEYPYNLPLADKRLNSVHSEILTEFMRELRAALDEAVPDRRVEIHARVLFSMYDTNLFGLDVRRWAKEGLVDVILSFPQRLYEKLPPEIMLPDGSIDMEKYSVYKETSEENTTYFNTDFDFEEPYVDCYGNSVGPKSQRERVEEFLEIEKEFGTKVIFDIMPRVMSPEENERRAKELYSYGAERLTLWDTNARYWRFGMWNTVKKLGHKDALLRGERLAEGAIRYSRILSIAGLDESKF